MSVPTGIIGVIHLAPMPGDPRHRDTGGFDAVVESALSDAEQLVEGGVDAMIIENFGSVPFRKGSAGARSEPHQIALMTRVALACGEAFDTPLGINCLRNDAPAALGVAATTGAEFIRVNVHVGAYVTDQGLIEGEAHDTLRYRRQIDARSVSIMADVLVKHATPLGPIEPEAATLDVV